MESKLKSEQEKLAQIEIEVAKLEQEIRNVKEGILADGNDVLDKLMVENSKLKFRVDILNRSIVNERKNRKHPANQSGMISVLQHLNEIFGSAIKSAYPNLENAPTIISESKTKNADYQCNSALAMCSLLKAQNIKESPLNIANKIKENCPPSALIENLGVAGAGFINISITKDFVVSAISSILRDGVTAPPYKKKRVVIDFSSPNIAKQMHVGHLRSTIIGESLARLLEYLGHDVLRLNHLGDWGTQFGMLIAHLEDRFPNFVKESPPISDLQQFYKESKKRFDEDEEFKKRAYDRVVKLQSGDKNCTKAWQLICDVSRIEFKQIYDALNVTIQERGESFYQSRMEAIVKEFEEKGFLEEDEGRKIMWGLPGDDTGGIPLTIVKTGGGYTYDTSDMATIRNRINEEKGDWLIYVTDVGQSTHFKIIFSCAKRVGIYNPDKVRIDHVGFGVVLGEDGKKFKTRSGDTVKLSELLEEGLKRSLDKLKEKGRDKVLTAQELEKAQTNVAYGCIKYADLSKNRLNEYVFSFDKMLDDKGNTAVYLLYAYTRIKSIARNCGADFVKNLEKLKKETKLELEHEKELKLAKTLTQFPDIIEKIVRDLHLHYLCEYLYQISCVFTEFYDLCYCIEKNKQGEIVKINTSRILLCEATAAVMRQCFDILGLETLEKI